MQKDNGSVGKVLLIGGAAALVILLASGATAKVPGGSQLPPLPPEPLPGQYGNVKVEFY